MCTVILEPTSFTVLGIYDPRYQKLSDNYWFLCEIADECTTAPYVGYTWSVGVATRYGLDCPGIESRWGARFSASVQTGSGAHADSCTVGTGSFPGLKRSGHGVDCPPSSSAEVKGRVHLYLYSPFESSWRVLG
jgi:hypothetical protein